MLRLVTLVATLLHFRARACVVLACLAAMLCAASTASALEGVQTKTRVWAFEFARPLNTWLEHAASPQTHLENHRSSLEPASVSPHAARGASKVLSRTPQALQKFFTKHGADFGLKGKWNPARAADASSAIHQHINNPAVRAIEQRIRGLVEGTYRGNPVTHF